ncbi:hypothetical protein LUZ60_010898 [Juncus effusus]|nr:hypothetical protein LUZ60_010898 [Juncus effusus]
MIIFLLLSFYKTSLYPHNHIFPICFISHKKKRSKMELAMDEKWKLSKRGSRSYNGSSKAIMVGDSSNNNGSVLKRSMTLKERGERRSNGSGRSFSGRCARLVKEQRARFYIMRRCVTMLICWRDYS